jgi:hypothetical protein
MIEGLKIEVSSAELVGHLRAKEAHHREKATAYQQQARGVEQLRPLEGQSSDPASALWKAHREHDSKAQLFGFLAGHVIDREVYRLDESDLIRIEIIDRYRWTGQC